MNKPKPKIRFKSNVALYGVSLALITVFIWLNKGEQRAALLKPATLYDFQLSMKFESAEKGISVSTYLPTTNYRQTVIDEKINAPHLSLTRELSPSGLAAKWQGNNQASKLLYQSKLKTKAVSYQIDDNLRLSDLDNSTQHEGLIETLAVPVNHPEIKSLWQSIKPHQGSSLKAVLKSIYDYTHQLEQLPFKGFTSSLTALRLGAASCNGKSRLFASLSRLNGIPTRLVGGVIMNNEKKRTSHQWVEVHVLGRWIPFDPTNGYFAELPAHFVELYRGDLPLFKHSANIRFDYQFSTQKLKVSPTFFPQAFKANEQFLNLASLLKQLSLPDNVVVSFLLFPLCALLISFMRNVIGVLTFGVFVPLLLAVACSYTGIWLGLMSITLIILFAFFTLNILERMRVLKVPRLAATISTITIMMLLTIHLSDFEEQINLSVLALLPVVIVSFVAEKLLQHVNDGDWISVLKKSIGSLFVVLTCYLAISSIYLQGFFAVFSEAFLLVLIGKIYIGRWNGIRLSELLRFGHLLRKGENVVGINERNREAIYRLNQSELLYLASDKLGTKKALSKLKIPVPPTLTSCQNQSEIENLNGVFLSNNSFVIKPNMGSQGNGIIVIAERKGGKFFSAGGTQYSSEQLLSHSSDIVSGSFSQNGDTDQVYLEPMLRQHDVLSTIAPVGLADIRVIVINNRIATAMLRLPTQNSDGKANLHQGAIGVAVNVESGKLERATIKGKVIDTHPDTDIKFTGTMLPDWQTIRKIALDCSKAIPLGYLGVDICIDESLGPLVLEVNGRPGLEIQNVNQKSLPRELIYQTAEAL